MVPILGIIGDKIKIEKVIGKPIVIQKVLISKSKFKDLDYARVQFYFEDDKDKTPHMFESSASGIVSTLKELRLGVKDRVRAKVAKYGSVYSFEY